MVHGSPVLTLLDHKYLSDDECGAHNPKHTQVVKDNSDVYLQRIHSGNQNS